ncbi:hypothetical protein [Methanosarcina siciliae]|nr:hypothetical protein [Methanosarcina siciliae]
MVTWSSGSNSAEFVRKIPGVALAGGINLRARKIPEIMKPVFAEKQAEP